MKFQQSLIALAVALVLAGTIHGVHAQQTPPADATQTEDKTGDNAGAPRKKVVIQGEGTADVSNQVVVTGIRASRQASLKQKRDADSVLDVVTSEDIGKLPDKNVADAVERIPGVNISSGSGGEGGFSENDRVSIRGTSPSLTQTTINGHSIATGDWYIGDQQSTVGRSVSFTLLPSEIVGSVEVEKSSQADYTEGGTVGNVNIVTLKPLDFKDTLTVKYNVQGMYADLPAKTSPQANALLSWKNDEGTLGVLVQGFYEKRSERRDGQELFLLGGGTIGDSGDNSSAVVAQHPDLNGVLYPAQIGSAAFTQTSLRSGAMFDVQLKPTSSLTLDLNGFYSRFHTDTFDTNYMASPLNMISQGISPTSYTVRGNTLESATFAAVPFDVNDPNPGSDEAFPGVRDSIYRPGAGSSTGYLDLDTKFRLDERTTITTQLGFTRGVGKTPHDFGYEAFIVDTPMSYSMNGNRGPAQVSFSGINTSDFNSPNVVNGGSWSQSASVVDQETYGQIDVLTSLESGLFESIKYGVRYAEHQRSSYDVGYGCSADTTALCYTNMALTTPKPTWSGTVSPSNFGAGIGFGPGYLQNFWILEVGNISAWENQYNNVNLGPAYQNNFDITEKDSAAYVMGNMSGDHWRGNIGVRLVNTHQNTLGYLEDANSGAFTPKQVTASYTDVLPSLNLKFDLNKDLVARFAASTTMSRPDYSAMAPAVVANNLDLTASGGNANLKRIKSNNLDGTLEWYFAPQSLLSAGLFYMDLPSYVTFGNNTQTLLNTNTQQPAQFLVTSPYNISAKNEGLELAWQQSFGSGFGGLLNFTLANGHDATGSQLVGSSKQTGNAEVYYEEDRFSARLAYNYRSTFLVGLANVTEQYAAGMGTVAASMNYKINDRLTLTFDGLNLNNPVIKYYSTSDQPQAFYSNGRQYFLGVRGSL